MARPGDEQRVRNVSEEFRRLRQDVELPGCGEGVHSRLHPTLEFRMMVGIKNVVDVVEPAEVEGGLLRPFLSPLVVDGHVFRVNLSVARHVDFAARLHLDDLMRI